VGDLESEPRWPLKCLILFPKLDLGDNQTRIQTMELIDLPCVGTHLNLESGLFDEWRQTERQKVATRLNRDGKLNLGSGDSLGSPLHGEVSMLSTESHSDDAIWVTG
jgi:hypothetical protein